MLANLDRDPCCWRLDTNKLCPSATTQQKRLEVIYSARDESSLFGQIYCNDIYLNLAEETVSPIKIQTAGNDDDDDDDDDFT